MYPPFSRLHVMKKKTYSSLANHKVFMYKTSLNNFFFKFTFGVLSIFSIQLVKNCWKDDENKYEFFSSSSIGNLFRIYSLSLWY